MSAPYIPAIVVFGFVTFRQDKSTMRLCVSLFGIKRRDDSAIYNYIFGKTQRRTRVTSYNDIC